MSVVISCRSERTDHHEAGDKEVEMIAGEMDVTNAALALHVIPNPPPTHRFSC